MESLSIKRVGAALALLAGASCGGPQLEGSLSTVLDLHYSRSSAASGPDQVVVRFIQPLDSGENVVLQVGAQLVGLDPNTLQFDLAESISQMIRALPFRLWRGVDCSSTPRSPQANR